MTILTGLANLVYRYSKDELFYQYCKSGCVVLLHHLLTVQFDLPNSAANHLPVFPCSANTAFNLFNFDISH